MNGIRSKPSISTPHSSLIVKSIGPIMRSRPWARSQIDAGLQQRRQDVRRVLELEEAEHAPAVAVVGVEVVVVLGADAAHDAPVAPGQEELRVAVREERVLRAHQEHVALQTQRGHPDPGGRVQPVREFDEFPAVPPARDGTDDHAHGDGPYQCRLPSTSSPRCAGTSARSSCARPARPTCCPTSAASRARPGPVVEMEGAERIMLGSNNYLGPDRRPARARRPPATRSTATAPG